MRIATLLAVALLAAVPLAISMPTAAQDQCSVATPCPLVVEVGPTGFVDQAQWNRSQGDTFAIEVDNTDQASHTVTLEGYGLTFVVPGDDSREQTVTLDKAGKFLFKDQPSGDQGTLTVVNGDVVSYESGLVDAQGNDVSGTTSTSGKAGIPGIELPILLCALGVVAFAVRRTD